ncbi:hypothetical protein CcI49_25680 [Frankia sp. CcI49]|nr:hypothetical protein CcI49_25680 [Frankia sp. CcI49]
MHAARRFDDDVAHAVPAAVVLDELAGEDEHQLVPEVLVQVAVRAGGEAGEEGGYAGGRRGRR